MTTIVTQGADSPALVIAVFRTSGQANAYVAARAGQGLHVVPGNIADRPLRPLVGEFWTGGVQVDAARPVVVAEVRAALKARTHRASIEGLLQNRWDWEHLSVTGDPSVGTTRWIYHSTAGIDRVIDGVWKTGAAVNAVAVHTAAQIEALVAGWEATMGNTDFANRRSVRFWYDAIAASAALSAQWAGVSILDGALIYTDTITVGGLLRGLDGGFIIYQHNAIPAGFSVETPNLRKAA